MDLQIFRNLEKLFSLCGAKGVRIGDRMEFRDGSDRLFVELRERRVLLSTLVPIAENEIEGILMRLLERWSPAFTEGVPLRSFALDGAIVVSCAMPQGSHAEAWYRMIGAQRRLLDACVKEQR